MTGVVHELLGAAAGTLTRSKSIAFITGVATHIIADSIPHLDIDPRLDVPLAAVLLIGISYKYGTDSTEFWGAVGGCIPDAEHATSMCGVGKKVFHTHVDDGKYHGKETKTRFSQILVAGAALAVLAFSSRNQK